MIWARTTKTSCGKCSSLIMGSASFAANNGDGNAIPVIAMYGPEVHYSIAKIAQLLRHKEVICWRDNYANALFHRVVDTQHMFEAMSADANSVDEVGL